MTSVLPANIQSSTRLCRTWNEIKAIGFRYNIHCNTSQTAAGSSTRERPGQIDETFNPTYWQMNKVRIDYSTWLLVSPAVGLLSSDDDSGTLASNCSSLSWQSPVHPTHRPWHLITTGATAVTKPPALHTFPQKKESYSGRSKASYVKQQKPRGRKPLFDLRN